MISSEVGRVNSGQVNLDWSETVKLSMGSDAAGAAVTVAIAGAVSGQTV